MITLASEGSKIRTKQDVSEEGLYLCSNTLRQRHKDTSSGNRTGLKIAQCGAPCCVWGGGGHLAGCLGCQSV